MADMTVNRADDLIKTSRELYNKLNPTSPEAKSFDAALNKLETAAKEPTLYPRGLYMTRGQLTDTQKKAIQGATDQVNKTRSAAERARAFAPDRVDKNPPAFTQPKEQPKQQPPQTVQNQGEDGIKRDP